MNFELKETYGGPIQKISILIMYIISYFTLPIIASVALPAMFWNTVAGIIYFMDYITNQLPIHVSTNFFLSFLFDFLFAFSIVNLFFINYFTRKDAYKINKSFISFLILNFLILGPLSLILDIFHPINYVISALFVFNGCQVIVVMFYYKFKNFIHKSEPIESSSIEKTNPNTPAKYIICPKCKINIRPDIINCPICQHKIAR